MIYENRKPATDEKVDEFERAASSNQGLMDSEVLSLIARIRSDAADLEALRARAGELEAERDSESCWAKEYHDKWEQAEARSALLAAALEWVRRWAMRPEMRGGPTQFEVVEAALAADARAAAELWLAYEAEHDAALALLYDLDKAYLPKLSDTYAAVEAARKAAGRGRE